MPIFERSISWRDQSLLRLWSKGIFVDIKTKWTDALFESLDFRAISKKHMWFLFNFVSSFFHSWSDRKSKLKKNCVQKNHEKSKFQKFPRSFCRTISKDQPCQILDWLDHFPETRSKISDEKKSWNNGFLSYGSRFSAIFAWKTHEK